MAAFTLSFTQAVAIIAVTRVVYADPGPSDHTAARQWGRRSSVARCLSKCAASARRRRSGHGGGSHKELTNLGYLVRVAETEAEGLAAARRGPAALLIVDRMLKGIDSLSMIETLRREGIRIPVLVVSALASVDERIRGLRPAETTISLSRLTWANWRPASKRSSGRSNDSRASVLQVGPLRIDLIERSAMRGERILDLLPTEFKLLDISCAVGAKSITRTMFLEDVWHYRDMPQTNLVDVHIGKLRHKVDMAGDTPLIRSVRGSGFMLHVGD